MNDVVVYAKHYCPYCARAKSLLRDKGVAVKEIEVAFDPDLQSEMVARSGRRTVSQVFIDGRHIGGHDDLTALNRSGELYEILAPAKKLLLPLKTSPGRFGRGFIARQEVANSVTGDQGRAQVRGSG